MFFFLLRNKLVCRHSAIYQCYHAGCFLVFDDNSKVTEEEEVQVQENNAQLLMPLSALTAVVPL